MRITLSRTFFAAPLACLALAVALMLSSGCVHRPPPDPVRLKLMSYNIRIGKGGGEWNNDPARVNLEPVARLIASHQPDIIGLQEVDRFRQRTSLMNQPLALSERLRMNIEFQPAYTMAMPGGTNEEYGIAVMSRYSIGASERFALFKPDYRKTHPNYPDYYSEQRGLLHAVVTIETHPVHVFVTHLGLTEDQRARQIAQIAEISSRYPGPKIIIGDFNAEPQEQAMSQLRNLYQDVLSAAGAAPEERKSYPAGPAPETAIDYIFVSEEFHVLNARVIRDGTLASDHNPVIAEVEFRPRPNAK